MTPPMIGPPIGVEPWKATNHSDMTRPRIEGSAVSWSVEFPVDMNVMLAQQLLFARIKIARAHDHNPVSTQLGTPAAYPDQLRIAWLSSRAKCRLTSDEARRSGSMMPR